MSLISSSPPWPSKLPAGLITPSLAMTSHTAPAQSSNRLQDSGGGATTGRKGFSIADILSEPSDKQLQSRTSANHGRAEPAMCSYLPSAAAPRDSHMFSLSQYFASAAVQQYASAPLLPRPLTVPLIATGSVSHHLHSSPSPSTSGKASKHHDVFTSSVCHYLLSSVSHGYRNPIANEKSTHCASIHCWDLQLGVGWGLSAAIIIGWLLL